MTARQTAAPTRYDRRMLAIMNNPAGRPYYATSARRRTFVAAHIALTAGLLTTHIGGVAARQPWLMVAGVLVVLPLWCIATGIINGSTRGLLELRARVLDERQLAERQRVHALAHRISVVMLFGAVLAVGALHWVGSTIPAGALPAVLVVALVTFWLMPLWTAGLTARDEVADDVIDEAADRFATGH
ncbi:hypothetical protein [Streptomyces sp. GS7]|uniref:hypothetical protein n=1 Tax=Streptomyces sp. GS7 TaxID=2692234 RepID=UPI001317C237|nr:hypothetical protein [Streptomyces sp. GS7]QHC25731.1 hypothetical protein GR130_34430 [Streptomyces sp. GS7]